MGTNTEYKVGMVSQILAAAQSSGSGAGAKAKKKANKKLAALFGGDASTSPPEAPPPTAGQEVKKKKGKDKKNKKSKKEEDTDTKKLKLKIKDALEAINGEEKAQKTKKAKKGSNVETEAPPKDTTAKVAAGGKNAKKKLRKKLKRLNDTQVGGVGGGGTAAGASPKSEAWIKKLEEFSEEPGQKKAAKKGKGKIPPSLNDNPAGGRYHNQGADKVTENGQGGADPPTRPVWKMSARKLEKRELKKAKRRERRRLELEGKEGVQVKAETQEQPKEEQKVEARDSDMDSDSDSGEKKVKVKVESKGAAAESKGEPKTLAEKNAPKIKNAELEARTIFVGNLPPDARRKELRRIFRRYGMLETIRFRCGAPNKPTVLKKVAINKKELHPDNDTLAAYIRYSTIEEAEKAAAETRGMLFHDHHLTVDVADQGKKRDTKLAIFVGNLNLKLTDEELWRFFEDCGTIVSVRIIRDNATGMGKGFGYVNFEDRDSVDAAITKKNQQELKNRSIRISRCVKKMKMKTHKGSKGGGGKKSFAGKQEGNAGPKDRKFGGKWKGKEDKKNSKVQNRSEPAHEYSGDRLAEIGKLKRKSNKPNRGEEKKANIVRLLTQVKPPNKKKTFK